MEVKVDPMLVLQCALEDDCSADGASDTESLTESQTSSDKLIESESNYDESKELNRKPYNCSFCPRCFTSEFALQSHMWNHLPQNKHIVLLNFNNSNNSTEWQQKTEEKNCEKYVITRSSSSTSSEAETSENGNAENNQNENENSLRFTCPICGKIISTKGNLKVHLETHRPKGKYGCDICGRM